MRRNLRLGLAIAIGCAVSSSCAVRDVTLDPDDAELPDASSSGSGGAGTGGSSGASGKGGQDAGGAGGQAPDAGPDAVPDGAGGTIGEDADASADSSGGAEAGGAGGQAPDASDDIDSPDEAAEDVGQEAEAGPTCSDDTQNGDETGVDCGGSCSSKCGLGDGCETGGDCQSSWCSAVSKQCVASQCEDGQKNGNESDTDCGAGCATKCAEGQTCMTGADCASASCNLGVYKCVDTACHDGQKSGDESDVDCGGSCSAKCINGKGCFVGGDCSSTYCNVANYKCVASECLDAAKDGSETDVDCGGGICPGCSTGLGCKAGTDCTSSVCNVVTLKCVSTICEDGLENGSETDVDCGGACPLKCAVGKGCLTGGDCASTLCHASSKVCVSTQCEDGAKNGAETDVDCGGSCPMKCGTGQACVTGSDCSSIFCNASSKVCVASQCLDGIKNGTETDSDCGGSCATKCGVGQACLTGSDCITTFCNASSGVCVGSQCLDGAKNGSETDVDCGGACSTKCSTGAGCLVGGDCVSTFCNTGSKLCVASSCLDGVKDYTETDVDCGGSCAAKCIVGKACIADGDCASTYCANFVCTTPSCSDGVKNQDEKEVDCSGSKCSQCPVALAMFQSGGYLQLATWENGVWTASPSQSCAGGGDKIPSLVFNSSGRALALVDCTGYLYHLTWDSTAGWSSQTYAQMMGGRPTMSWGGGEWHAVVNTGIGQYKYMTFASSWSVPEIVPVSQDPSIAARGTDATIGYFASDGSTMRAWARDRNADVWSGATNVAPHGVSSGNVAVVAMTAGPELMMAWVGDDSKIYWATRTGGVWTAAAAIDPMNAASNPDFRVGLAALPGGGAVLTWRLIDGYATMQYSVYSGGQWGPVVSGFQYVSTWLHVAPGLPGNTAEFVWAASNGKCIHSSLKNGTLSTPVPVGGSCEPGTHPVIAVYP